MKSFLMIPVLVCLMANHLFSDSVTQADAEKAARHFYFEKYNLFQGTIGLEELELTLAFVREEDGATLYYFFTVNLGGYVIVSADDCLFPVLGYSFTGRYSRESSPPQGHWLCKLYEERIKAARQHSSAPSPDCEREWAHYLPDDFRMSGLGRDVGEVEPLLTTEWNQDFPYNYYCPADQAGPGGHTYAGCAATSFAQISYYWRWPEFGSGEHCYTPATNPEYGEQCADFGNTAYRWNEMVDSPNLPIVNTAIAELIYHAAVSIDMDFGPDISGPAGGYYAPIDLEYFRYDPSWQTVYIDSTDMVTFRETLRNELAQGRPVVYAGAGYDYSGMHACICDGFQDSLYFHFNLGWSGQFDGYYLLDDFMGLNFHQYFLAGVMPDTVNNTYPLFATGPDTLYSLNGSIADGSGPVHNYPDNILASWLIDPQTNEDSVTYIDIQIKRLDLAEDGDRLFIYDGADASAPLIAELAGDSIPGAISTTGNKAFVVWTTDGSGNGPGFYLNYHSRQPSPWCSGTTYLSAPSDTIDDGSGPFNYYNSTTCTWFIDPGTSGPLNLHFNYFSTEDSADLLKIFDPGTKSLLAELSGHYADPPEPVTSPSGMMMLAFVTGNAVTDNGWEAWYDVGTGMTETNVPCEMKIRPNPAADRAEILITISQEQEASVEILDAVSGKLQYTFFESLETGQNRFLINIDHLPSGIYICRLKSGIISISEKMIVTR